MNRDQFQKIDSEEAFVALLKKHKLFRDDDVALSDLDEGSYVYTGNDFCIDVELFEELDIGNLLIAGNIDIDDLNISDILPDFGLFCVIGDVDCKDFYYCTEMTGVSIGGNLAIKHIFFADCGNSSLQVNGDLITKLAYVSQCSVEVGGQKKTKFDEGVTREELMSIGLSSANDAEPEDIIEAYFASRNTPEANEF